MPTLTNIQSESDTAHADEPSGGTNGHPAVDDAPDEFITPAAIFELSKSIGADVLKLDFRRGTYTRRRTDAPYSSLPLTRDAPSDATRPDRKSDATASIEDLTHIDLSV
jgi:hypothetical protein